MARAMPTPRCVKRLVRQSIIDVIWISSSRLELEHLHLHIFLLALHMFSRLNQVARHLSRPIPNYLHNSAFAGSAAMAQNRSNRMINTAACLIIGDEVLGGKVYLFPSRASRRSIFGR